MTHKNLCAICGERPATTRDHIPPAGIFPKPRPSDLVTVPCCLECNNSGSMWDERFRVYLSLHVARNDPEWQNLLEKNVIPTLNHNRRLTREIFESTKNIMLKTPGGLYLGKVTEIRWDSEAHDRVIERTIRGLHYHHTGEILGNRATVHVKFFESLEKVASAFDAFPLHSIGDGQVLYKVICDPKISLRSAWVFEFRGWKWSGGYVQPN